MLKHLERLAAGVAIYGPETPREELPDDVIDELVGLGPTEHLQQLVDRIMASEQREADSGRKTKRRMSEADERLFRWTYRNLQSALLRDRLQNERWSLGERFEGCWCLGRGGKRPRALSVRVGPPKLDETEYAHGPSGEPEMIWTQFCPCPDGVAAEAEAQERKAHVLREIEKWRITQITGVARIPAALQGRTVGAWAEAAAARKGSSREHVDGITTSLMAWDASVRKLTADGEVPKPSILLLAGPFGGGKTTIAAAIAQAYLKRHEGVLFRHTTELNDELREAWGRREQTALTQAEMLRAYTAAALLVIDDLGAEDLSDTRSVYLADVLVRILDTRVNNYLPTIITTNLSSGELRARLGDRLMSRLEVGSYAHLVVIDTPNLREVAA